MRPAKKTPAPAKTAKPIKTKLAGKGKADSAPEPFKGISIRLPMSLYSRIAELSFERRKARGAHKLERGAGDPFSMHGLVLTAVEQFLEREKH